MPRCQISLRNFQLLAIAVTGELDYFHAIAQRRRNWSQLICCADEKDFRKIEGEIEIVIGERIILFRIENLEQRRCRIATIVGAQLVNLVQHHYRIVYSGAAD